MEQITPAYIAAPILAQRNIELADISVSYDALTLSTVFTMRATDGTIGVISVSARTLAAVNSSEAIREILEPLFQTVEFSSGKPAIPEVQPPIPEPSPEHIAQAAKSGKKNRRSITQPVDEGSSVAEDVTEGAGQHLGHDPVQVDE